MDRDELAQCPFCKVHLPAWNEQEHFDTHRNSDEENSEAKNKKGKTHRQRKRKSKKYHSSTESESEEDKVSNIEIEKLVKGIRSNTDAVNDLSQSAMKMIKGFNSDLEKI